MKHHLTLLVCLIAIKSFSQQGSAIPTTSVNIKPVETTSKPSVPVSDSSIKPANKNIVGLRSAVAASPKIDTYGTIKATEGPSDDAALELDGAIKVSGSNKAAFQINMGTLSGNPSYFGTGAANSIDYYRITTPMIANDPTAIIIVTPVSSVLSFPYWVGYDASNLIGGGAGQWYIAEPRNSSGVGGFINGMRFNVMIIKQ